MVTIRDRGAIKWPVTPYFLYVFELSLFWSTFSEKISSLVLQEIWQGSILNMFTYIFKDSGNSVAYISSFFTEFNSLYTHCNFQFKWWVLTVLAVSNYSVSNYGHNILDAGSKFLYSRKHYVIQPQYFLILKCMLTLF